MRCAIVERMVWRSLVGALVVLAAACTAATRRTPEDDAAALGEIGGASGVVAAAPAEVPSDDRPELEACLGLEALDGRSATAEAKARGFRVDLYPSAPVRCPALPTLEDGAENPLAARGGLAPLVVDLEAFLRPEVGVREAVALLGPALLCSNSYARFLDVHTAPSIPGVLQASFTIDDGELIEVQIEFEASVEIAWEELTRRFGASTKSMPGPHSHYPPDDHFDVAGVGIRGYFLIGTDERGSTRPRRHVRRLSLRRHRVEAPLPQRFASEADLVALAAHALGARPRDAHEYYGVLGKQLGSGRGSVRFETSDEKNLRAVTIETDEGAPHDARSIAVKVVNLVTVSPDSFAAALAAATDLPPPTVERRPEAARITALEPGGRARGEVVLGFLDGRVKTMTIRRLDLSPQTSPEALASARVGYPYVRLRVEGNPVEALDLPLDAAALRARGVRSYRAFTATEPRIWLLVFERSGEVSQEEVERGIAELLPDDGPPYYRESTATGPWVLVTGFPGEKPVSPEMEAARVAFLASWAGEE